MGVDPAKNKGSRLTLLSLFFFWPITNDGHMSRIGTSDDGGDERGVVLLGSYDWFRAACLSFLAETAHTHDDTLSLGSHQFARQWTWQEPLQHHALAIVHGSSAGLFRSFPLPVTALTDVPTNEAGEVKGYADALPSEVEDEAAVHTTSINTSLYVTQSIHWSCTWRVPVLYFHANWSSGEPMSLDQLTAFGVIHDSGTLQSALLRPDTAEDSNSYFVPVSYGDHPRTGLPSFYLHPCQTGRILSDLLPESYPSHLYIEAFLNLCASAVEMRT